MVERSFCLFVVVFLFVLFVFWFESFVVVVAAAAVLCFLSF